MFNGGDKLVKLEKAVYIVTPKYSALLLTSRAGHLVL